MEKEKEAEAEVEKLKLILLWRDILLCWSLGVSESFFLKLFLNGLLCSGKLPGEDWCRGGEISAVKKVLERRTSRSASSSVRPDAAAVCRSLDRRRSWSCARSDLTSTSYILHIEKDG